MNLKTPTAGRQLSSSLRERLKKCGRYHASPSPGGSIFQSISSTPVQSCSSVTEVVISPHSRKRCSSSPADKSENFKRPQTEKDLIKENTNLPNFSYKTETIKAPVSKEESIVKQVDLDSRSGLLAFDRRTTPLSSRSRFKKIPLRSNRLNFQPKFDLEDTAASPCSTERKLSLQNLKSSQDISLSKLSSNVSEEEVSGSTQSVNITVRQNIDRDQTELTLPSTSIDLLTEIKVKEETLRKLKMVNTYRTKNNLVELQALIDKWRRVSQEALHDLHCEMLEPRPTLSQLIDHLGIEHGLVQYNADGESFN